MGVHYFPIVKMVASTTHSTISSFGKKLSVVYFDGQKYLIGVQIASLLKRETFNMYRSMKIKNIRIKRADPKQVDYLCECNAVRPGTHSVTLIPFESGLYFIADAWHRQHKSSSFGVRKTNFISDKPRLHRRKPHPWDVHRSLKKEFVKKNNITLEEPVFPIKTPTASPESSPTQTSMVTLSDLHRVACENFI